MNEKNGRLVFLWSGVDSRSTLSADSKQGLGADSQVISLYFIVVLVLFWLSCISFGIRANTDLFEASSQSIQNQKNITKKKKKKSIHLIFFLPPEGYPSTQALRPNNQQTPQPDLVKFFQEVSSHATTHQKANAHPTSVRSHHSEPHHHPLLGIAPP